MASWWFVGLASPLSLGWPWCSAWCPWRPARSTMTWPASSTQSLASSTPCCWRSWSSQRGRTSGGWVLIDDIRATLQGYEPRTAAEEQLYAEGLDQVQRLADARRTRLVAAEEGLPTVLWVVLVVAGMVVVGFAFLFGLENTGTHALMVVALAGVIALVLFTIGAMEHPFSGGARVGTEAFDLILERFETSKLSNLR